MAEFLGQVPFHCYGKFKVLRPISRGMYFLATLADILPNALILPDNMANLNQPGYFNPNGSDMLEKGVNIVLKRPISSLY